MSRKVPEAHNLKETEGFEELSPLEKQLRQIDYDSPWWKSLAQQLPRNRISEARCWALWIIPTMERYGVSSLKHGLREWGRRVKPKELESAVEWAIQSGALERIYPEEFVATQPPCDGDGEGSLPNLPGIPRI
jgi:hypothetical protein